MGHPVIAADLQGRAQLPHNLLSFQRGLIVALEGYTSDGCKYRINPKTGLTVEKRLPSGRWQVVSTHATRQDAKARWFQLTGGPRQRGASRRGSD